MSSFNFQDGEILLFDKPLEWTSFDVVNKIRFLLKHEAGIEKIKVGHAGTLDPLATGLLVICTGKFTKQINDLTLLDKEYTGVFTLGATTPSFDLETEFNRTFPVDHINPGKIELARKSLTGKIFQKPPIYSAKKIKGKKAYQYARESLSLKMKPKEVEIYEFEITDIDMPDVSFRVSCSKGTYIRSLAYDFGKALKSGAHLSALRRTRVGEFTISDAINLEQFEFLLKN
jgi:tRNA pseudouridine55 synthase